MQKWWKNRAFTSVAVIAVGATTVVGAYKLSKRRKITVGKEQKRERQFLLSVEAGASSTYRDLNLGASLQKPKSAEWDFDWDWRNPSAQSEKMKMSQSEKKENQQTVPVATRHVILVRHGQFNATGKHDRLHSLTELGREQAQFTGKRLRELGHEYNVLINSDMTRAIETADILAKQLPASIPREETCILREGAPYLPEPKINYWKPPHKFWYHNARMEAAFRKYFHRANPSQIKDSYELIVCHGNLIRYLICRLLQFPPEAWLRFGVAHGSITWTSVYPDGSVVLHSLGEAGHIPAEKLSGIPKYLAGSKYF